jgi:hypothetical protein
MCAVTETKVEKASFYLKSISR